MLDFSDGGSGVRGLIPQGPIESNILVIWCLPAHCRLSPCFAVLHVRFLRDPEFWLGVQRFVDGTISTSITSEELAVNMSKSSQSLHSNLQLRTFCLCPHSSGCFVVFLKFVQCLWSWFLGIVFLNRNFWLPWRMAALVLRRPGIATGIGHRLVPPESKHKHHHWPKGFTSSK